MFRAGRDGWSLKSTVALDELGIAFQQKPAARDIADQAELLMADLIALAKKPKRAKL